ASAETRKRSDQLPDHGRATAMRNPTSSAHHGRRRLKGRPGTAHMGARAAWRKARLAAEDDVWKAGGRAGCAWRTADLGISQTTANGLAPEKAQLTPGPGASRNSVMIGRSSAVRVMIPW